MNIDEILKEFAPVAYMREWEGDISDLGNMIFETSKEDCDASPNWQELLTLTQVSELAARMLEEAADLYEIAEQQGLADHPSEGLRNMAEAIRSQQPASEPDKLLPKDGMGY